MRLWIPARESRSLIFPPAFGGSSDSRPPFAANLGVCASARSCPTFFERRMDET